MKWVRTFRSFGFKFIFSRVIKTDNYKLTLVYPNILKWEWTFVAIWKSICKIYWNDINVLRKAGIAENIYYLFEGLFLGSKILICLRDLCFCPLKLYIGFCLSCFKTSPGIILKCALRTEVNGTNLQKFKRSPHTLNDLLTRVFWRGKKPDEYFWINPYWTRIECLLRQLKWSYKIIVNPVIISLFWREVKPHCLKMNKNLNYENSTCLLKKKNFNLSKEEKNCN